VLAASGPDVANFRAQRAQPPQVKRGPAQLLDYTAATLDKSLAIAPAITKAYDLSVAAYLEGFELVKARWTTSTPTCARTPRRP
jgi:high-affinity iron transporter